MDLENLINQAYERGQTDRANGWTKADAVDIADLVTEIPVKLDVDGFPTQATKDAENAISDAYAAGYQGVAIGQQKSILG